ncbi:hypothetical protein TTHERM_000002749 (macronuclear) [Tetrahymena thermophila SB210]|uniref:Uncharacterized protein n=1 Tax=Tetrahymena thermophila (strain SB210) TaxID=312017 RepID=W7XEV8_TETTS|nr:hypothetical protein TTHERM_000002749 [Tetrahymena thermophila SB210]EWS76302.1 hypothetical protein TTHERM_000002749 [Tetrahymena thermophila SB210]|eukprot:XP_012651086.1 hypothetical protein TTHERM_000002749 [Tetrahymena thermophila SB210]
MLLFYQQFFKKDANQFQFLSYYQLKRYQSVSCKKNQLYNIGKKLIEKTSNSRFTLGKLEDLKKHKIIKQME